MNKEAKLRIYITAKTALKFRSEACVLKKREKKLLEAAQIKFLRRLLGIQILHKENNQCIRGKKPEAQNVLKEIKQYQKKGLQHVQRMDTDRIPKQALQ
jgi:1,2-phenylacetyl-CoA epoxidase PaaB subunit